MSKAQWLDDGFGNEFSMEIREGDTVLVKSAFGNLLKRKALSNVVPGEDFPIVWVCTEDEWESAQSSGRKPRGVPWPAEDVAPPKAPPPSVGNPQDEAQDLSTLPKESPDACRPTNQP